MYGISYGEDGKAKLFIIDGNKQVAMTLDQESIKKMIALLEAVYMNKLTRG